MVCGGCHKSLKVEQQRADFTGSAQLRATSQRKRTQVGHGEQNGYAERVIRTIKEEEVSLTEYRDYGDALAQLGHFIDDVYLTKRIHSALGYLTPAEYEAQWPNQQTASIL